MGTLLSSHELNEIYISKGISLKPFNVERAQVWISFRYLPFASLLFLFIGHACSSVDNDDCKSYLFFPLTFYVHSLCNIYFDKALRKTLMLFQILLFLNGVAHFKNEQNFCLLDAEMSNVIWLNRAPTKCPNVNAFEVFCCSLEISAQFLDIYS